MLHLFIFVADLCHLFFHNFFVSFTFFLSMENEGLKEGARPRIQMHPPKMGDRRWEERVAGAGGVAGERAENRMKTMCGDLTRGTSFKLSAD